MFLFKVSKWFHYCQHVNMMGSFSVYMVLGSLYWKKCAHDKIIWLKFKAEY